MSCAAPSGTGDWWRRKSTTVGLVGLSPDHNDYYLAEFTGAWLSAFAPLARWYTTYTAPIRATHPTNTATTSPVDIARLLRS